VDPSLVTSMALRMQADGIQASSGGRIETHVIAQYEFRLGEGNRVDDRSSVAPLMPLTLIGDYEWQQNWGIKFNDGRAQASVNNSSKLFNELTGTGEYTLEAWVFPANVTQDDNARIVSYSGGTTARNFTLGQSLYNYEAHNRSSVTDTNGLPALITDNGDEDAQAALQHVVVTFHPDVGRKIYVNGVDTGDSDAQGGGNFNNWDSDFALVLGNEVSGNRPWQGTMRFLAIHKRALSAADIQTNFDAGVGQKYFMMFRLHTLNDGNSDPDSFLVFTVSQYDNYSYLFSEPFYFVPGQSSVPTPFTMRGLRIGVNGKVPTVGQSFATLDMTIDDTNYSADTGHPVSSRGTLVRLELGSDIDQFFLSFEQLGGDSNVFVEATFDAPVFSGSGLEYSDIGLRNFLEIRESFAQVTGIDSSITSVRDTYDLVVQQLPSSEDILGFLSAHQMGVAQLAIAYCGELIDSQMARSDLNITLSEDVAGNVADEHNKSVADWDTQFIDPLL
ncbi:MAG: LamG domain-containing protein, partial [Pseudomonadales bacterium]|nr:LamG domain-containing protein [Pseudomonadales bacterium]